MKNKEFDALYSYGIRDPISGNVNRFQVLCVVIGETDKSYKIRLKGLIQHRLPDEELWVRKRNIFKSHKDNISEICDLYNLKVTDEICKACLNNCFGKSKFVNKV